VPAHILNGTSLSGSTNHATVPSGRAMVMGTKTGRMSAKQPNFSNPPRKPDRNINDDVKPEEKKALADHMVRSGMMGKPKCDCTHFEPQFICRHKIPRDLRPNTRVLERDGLVLESPALEEIIQRLKEEEYERRFQKYKATQRNLPSCPQHAYLKVVTVPVPEGRHFDPMWEADLWFVCAHEGDDVPQPQYRGYELIV